MASVTSTVAPIFSAFLNESMIGALDIDGNLMFSSSWICGTKHKKDQLLLDLLEDKTPTAGLHSPNLISARVHSHKAFTSSRA